ncbi:MAG: hypothetical protein IPK53_04055 [bacterium]|nr:hypothetical protein [bacterium]
MFYHEDLSLELLPNSPPELFDASATPQALHELNLRQLWYSAASHWESFQSYTNTEESLSELLNVIVAMISDPQSASPRVLGMTSAGEGCAESCGHAVFPYRVTRLDRDTYQISVYDPNAPGDSTRNIVVVPRQESWYATFIEECCFESPGYIVLSDQISTYDSNPEPLAPIPNGVDSLVIHIGSDYHLLTNSQGYSVGYNGEIVNDIGGSFDIPFVGYPHPPVSWTLPEGAYDVILGLSPESKTHVIASSGSLSLSGYSNSFEGGGSSEEVHFGLDFANQTISASWGDPTDAYPVRLSHLQVIGEDEHEFHTEVPQLTSDGELELRLDNSQYKVRNDGPAALGSIGFTALTSGNQYEFEGTQLTAPATSQLILTPVWNEVQDYITALVDSGFDGSIDDTLLIENFAYALPSPVDLVIQVQGNDVQLTWSPVPVSNVYYRAYSDTTSGGVFQVRIGTTSDTTFVDSNVIEQPDSRKFYIVRAFHQ